MEEQPPFTENIEEQAFLHEDGEVPPFVDINVQSEQDRNKEMLRIGDMAEKKISDGELVFMEEGDRAWLKAQVEGTGVDMTKIEDNTNLSEQAKGLVETLGKDRTIKLVKDVVTVLLKSPGGNVMGKSDPFYYPEKVEKYIEDFMGGKEKQTEPWQKNTVYRIEAVMSVTNKLMWILGADSEAEGVRRQGTEGVKKHLRERVLRGCERGGDIIPEGIERYDRDKIIRHLPKGGLGAILEHLTKI
jgi:hypothetical protein